MESDDLTVRVLIEIRDELRTTNQRIDGLEKSLGARIDETNKRIDRLDSRLDLTNRRMAEGEIRTATALADVTGAIRDVHWLLKDRFDLRDRVEKCEREIEELKRRDV
jgi:hypothetical protein